MLRNAVNITYTWFSTINYISNRQSSHEIPLRPLLTFPPSKLDYTYRWKFRMCANVNKATMPILGQLYRTLTMIGSDNPEREEFMRKKLLLRVRIRRNSQSALRVASEQCVNLIESTT